MECSIGQRFGSHAAAIARGTKWQPAMKSKKKKSEASSKEEALEAVKQSKPVKQEQQAMWEPFPRETPASASTARVSRLFFSTRAHNTNAAISMSLAHTRKVKEGPQGLLLLLYGTKNGIGWIERLRALFALFKAEGCMN